jgi:protein-disulfide isomerase
MLSLAGGVVVVGVAGYFGWRQFAPSPAPVAMTPPPGGTLPNPTGDQRMAERGLGDPNAKVVVREFFSLTCTHCASFVRNAMPGIEKDLIGPGKVRFVYHDFPLDQVALTASMVARYLPPAQYHNFITALLANQDRWAFARGINTTEEIWKFAALAGMGRATFDQAVADSELRNWILQQQQADQDRWKINSTPSFVINGKTHTGEMSYEAFRKLMPEV